jgi:hypothetical protein
MLPRTVRWRVYVLVGGVVALVMTTGSTALATPRSWVDLVTILCGGLAVIVGGVLVVVQQRSLGRVVDSMRERIQRETRASEQLVRQREAERIAQDLGATAIRDLFGISLRLQSAAARHPSAAPTLRAVTADMDRVLREIRSRVFSGDRTIGDVLTALEPELPASPRVDGRLSVTAPPALESFLCDLLPQFPAAADVSVTIAYGRLHVRITGTPPEDPAVMKETAADHGATTTYEPDHVVVEWTGLL